MKKKKKKKKRIYLACHKKRALAFLIDFSFMIIMAYLCLLKIYPQPKLEYLTVRLSLIQHVIIEWKTIFILLVIPPLPTTLLLYYYSRTPGQFCMNLMTKSYLHRNHDITLKQAFIKIYSSYCFNILFIGIPNLLSILGRKKRSLNDKVAKTFVTQIKRPSKKTWIARVSSIFLLCWLIPINLILWKKIITNFKLKKLGIELFTKNAPSLLERKKQRGIVKKIRTPTQFRSFFQELRWSLIWQDMERHLHLLTPNSRLLVSLNLESYKTGLPYDIKFSHLEKTKRKGYYKLYYYRIDQDRNIKNLEFFYLTRNNKYWQLDHSKLFLNHFLGKTST